MLVTYRDSSNTQHHLRVKNKQELDQAFDHIVNGDNYLEGSWVQNAAPESIVYSKDDIAEIANDAINALCLSVQTRLGITNGFNASIFWSDTELTDIIEAYVTSEIQNMEASRAD